MSSNKYIAPAWRVTYTLKGYDANRMLTSWTWEGSIENERYRLTGPSQDDPPTVMGRVAVTSWQPYKKDALSDASRAVQDVCVVVGAIVGGLYVEPDTPPVETEALGGAQSQGGIGISDSVSFALKQKLDGRDHLLKAVKKVEENPLIRADVDTFQIATSQRNPASATIHRFRIYERHAQEILDKEALLIAQKETREGAANALIAALGDGLTADESGRIKQSIINALSRIRKRPRLDVIHEYVQALPGCENISRQLLSRIDSRRGAVAHNPTVLDEEISDQEAESALAQIVHALIRRELGIGSN